MSDKVTGLVEVVHKNQDKGIWSLKLQDGDWFSFYKTQPSCNKGDMVEFEFKQNGNFKNADPKTLTVTGGATASTYTTSTPSFADNVQDSIVYQSSRKDAIEVIKIAIANDGLTLPAKKGDKLDAIVSSIEELANQFALKAANPTFRELEKEIANVEGDELDG